MIVLWTTRQRENEGDIVVAAEKVTPEAINFMVRNGCGILGLALSPAICDRLNLEPLPGRNIDAQATPGRLTSTPAPASPPAPPPTTAPAPSRWPSTSAPRRPTRRRQGPRPRTARPRGRRAGPRRPHRRQHRPRPPRRFQGRRVICEIMTPDGRMARLPDLRAFCDQHI